MVTGRLPFQGQGMMETLRALATETPPAPHEVESAIPQPLSALIMNLLAKDRSARPASAAAVIQALQALQEEPTIPVSRDTPVTPAAQARQLSPRPRSARRRLVPAVLAALALLGMTA